jgi:hypothetical protein
VPDARDAGDLYALAPEEFTAARDALARRLRAAKDRAGADAVKHLKRPTAIAWALNQAARADGELVGAVLAAGAQARQATADGDGEGMRRADRAMRKAADAVVEVAGRVLTDAGRPLSDDARSRMVATLRAAALDADVADRLRSATLERDVELAGLGLDGGVMAVGPRAPASPHRAPRTPSGAASGDEITGEGPAGEKTAGEKTAGEKTAEAKAAREERRKEEEERRAARLRVAELESTADRLARRADRLAAAADAAEEAGRHARAQADQARAEAEAAADAAATAHAQATERSGPPRV